MRLEALQELTSLPLRADCDFGEILCKNSLLFELHFLRIDFCFCCLFVVMLVCGFVLSTADLVCCLFDSMKFVFLFDCLKLVGIGFEVSDLLRKLCFFSDWTKGFLFLSLLLVSVPPSFSILFLN